MPEGGSFLKGAFRRHEVQIASIVVVMAVLFSALSPAFASGSNLITLLESYSVMAIMAAGLLVVLISGGIDISFAAIAAVSQYLVATILVQMGRQLGGGLCAGGALWRAPWGGQRLADPLPASALGDRDHFDDDLLLCDPDVCDRWEIDLRFTGLVYGDDRPLGDTLSGGGGGGGAGAHGGSCSRGSPLGGRSMGWGATWKGPSAWGATWWACSALSTATRE